jgi:hypothetical protein
LNSNNEIEFIFLSNLFVLLQISEGLNYLNLIQTNGLKKVKVHYALGLSPQRGSACSAKVTQLTWGLSARGPVQGKPVACRPILAGRRRVAG